MTRITITTQLLLWFLIISLIPCAVLTGIISFSANRSLKKTVRQGLLAIADAKATQLETFIRERRADLNMASRFTMIADSMPKLAEARRKEPARFTRLYRVDSEVPPVYGEFRRIVRLFQRVSLRHGWTVLFQLKPDLELGSNLLTGPLKESELAEVFDRVRTLLANGGLGLPDVPRAKRTGGVHCQPLSSMPQGRIVGFLALELSNEQVFRVLKDYSGLGETGEAMVAMRRGKDEFIYVAPPRNSDGDSTQVPGQDTAMPREPPCKRPSQGQRGYGEAIDYRGKPVVAAWSYLPSYRWGMVVKQDDGEAFALDLPADSRRGECCSARRF